MLVEAGPKDTILGSKYLGWKIHMPATLTYNLCDDKYNWYYHTLPQRNVNNRVMYWPRGRVWGGSSSLNAMVYVRSELMVVVVVRIVIVMMMVMMVVVTEDNDDEEVGGY